MLAIKLNICFPCKKVLQLQQQKVVDLWKFIIVAMTAFLPALNFKDNKGVNSRQH